MQLNLKPTLGWQLRLSVVCVVLAAGLMVGYVFAKLDDINHQPAPVGVAYLAPKAKETAGKPKLPVPLKTTTVQAYLESVKPALNLPAPVQIDPNQVVTEAGQLPADYRTQTATCTFDVSTGKGELYFRRDPAPLFAWDFNGDAGMFLGTLNGALTVRLAARQALFTIKDARFGGMASIDQPLGALSTPPVTLLGLGVWVPW